VLGWDHRFTTTLETAAPVVDGILDGDLFIRGTGDATINTRENRSSQVLDAWADALKRAGITAVRGRIIGDDQAFDDEGLGDGWSWDYLQFGYAAPVGALQFDENVATLTVCPAPRRDRPPSPR
jgi:serine-type D-Ala-D-Ala carboxypeptidase/endopeptidase (penicillin-binding protein 4)